MKHKQTYRLLVLWAEVMPYNVACFRDFVSSGGEIDVYCWGKDKKLTPYQAPEITGVRYFPESYATAKSICDHIKRDRPDLVIVVGRMESKYLEAARFARELKIPVAGCADNQFTGSLRQILARLLSHVLYRRYFDYMLVPGLYQYEYMRYLGFRREKIRMPQYCADVQLFEQAYRHRGDHVSERDTVLFCGRMDPVKGVDILIESFIELRSQGFTGKLLLIGGGDYYQEKRSGDGITYLNFLDQHQIVDMLGRVRVFCLPSRDEPWGLVIHEYAAAGIPLVTTRVCGASSAFLREGYNGYFCDSNDRVSLKDALLKVFSLSDRDWLEFSDRSYELSRQITPALWTSTVKSMMEC